MYDTKRFGKELVIIAVFVDELIAFTVMTTLTKMIFDKIFGLFKLLSWFKYNQKK